LEEFKDEIREGKYEEITKTDNVLNGRIQSVLANLKKNNSKEDQHDEPEIEKLKQFAINSLATYLKKRWFN